MAKMIAVALLDFIHVYLRTELALELTSQRIIMLYDLICPFTKALASFPEVICPRHVFFLNKQLLSAVPANHVLFLMP